MKTSEALLKIAESLRDGNTDDAIDQLIKTAEIVKNAEDAEPTPTPTDDPVADPVTDPVSDTPSDPEPTADPIEKTALSEEMQQEIKKYIDLYVSGDDVIKLLQGLKGQDFEEIFKTVTENKKKIEKMAQGSSKQISKTADAPEKSVRDDMPFG